MGLNGTLRTSALAVKFCCPNFLAAISSVACFFSERRFACKPTASEVSRQIRSHKFAHVSAETSRAARESVEHSQRESNTQLQPLPIGFVLFICNMNSGFPPGKENMFCTCTLPSFQVSNCFPQLSEENKKEKLVGLPGSLCSGKRNLKQNANWSSSSPQVNVAQLIIVIYMAQPSERAKTQIN